MNAADLTSGSVVDRYTIQRILGEGGMAVVYLVEHNQLGSKHALKVLTIASRQVRERLLLEGRAQATLRHPNVVTVTDVVDIGGSPGLIMEFIEGPSLDDYLESQKLSVDQVDQLARGILAGVAAAHDAGLVHRDLKPANIMLSIGTGGLVPKVTDFGLAKIVEQGDKSKTRTGSTMGTPHYMSPEQIDDSKNVGPGTDIWALGAILYEMLTGLRAFPGDNLLSIFSAVNKGEYRPIAELVPDVPERMARAIDLALKRDVAERPASVQELYGIWAGDEQAQLGVSSGGPLMGPWDAAAISQARQLATGPEATWADSEPRSGETLADQPTSKSSSMLQSRAAWIGVGGTFFGVTAVGLALLAVIIAGGGVAYVMTRPTPVMQTAPTIIVEGNTQVPAPTDAPPTDAPRGSAMPRPGGAPAPSPRTAPASAAPMPVPEQTDAIPVPEQTDPVPVPVPEQTDPVAVPEQTEPVPVPEQVDTGDAVADAEPPPPAPVANNPDGLVLGLLASPNADERLDSVRRKVGSPNEDTSALLEWVLKNDDNGTVRQAALDGIIQLWDNDQGDWSVNSRAMRYAMSLNAIYAVPAAEAYGRNGSDPDGLRTALKHSSADVRKAAVQAAGDVIPRGPVGYDGRALVEPLTADADAGVLRAAQKVMKKL